MDKKGLFIAVLVATAILSSGTFAWLDTDWKARMPITFYQNSDTTNRTNEFVTFWVNTSGSYQLLDCDEVRLGDGSDNEMESIIIDASDEDNGNCLMGSVVNRTEGGNFTPYAYYNNSGASSPTYTDRVTATEDSGYWLISGYNYKELYFFQSAGSYDDVDDSASNLVLDFNTQTCNLVYDNGGEILGGTETDDTCVLVENSTLRIRIECDASEDSDSDGYCEAGETCVFWYFYPNYWEYTVQNTYADSWFSGTMASSDNYADIYHTEAGPTDVHWTTTSSVTAKTVVRGYTVVETNTAGVQGIMVWDEGDTTDYASDGDTVDRTGIWVGRDSGVWGLSGNMDLEFRHTLFYGTISNDAGKDEENRFDNPLDVDYGSEETQSGNSPPYYTDVSAYPSSPQNFGISSVFLNISWTDADGNIDKAWIVHNFSGSEQTIEMDNDTATHFYHEIDYSLSAGGYEYTFHANDTEASSNNTATYYYTVNKASTTINLAINGTEANVTETYPYPVNVTGWKSVAGGTLTLQRNGSSKSNPEIIQLGAGMYNYTLSLDHENYTASAVTRWLEIEQASSGLTLSASPGWTTVENTEVTISCSASFNTTLYRDGVIVSNPYSALLSFGYYNFTCIVDDQANYTPGSTTSILTVESGGFGCSDTDTFAFEQNISVTGTFVNLNFTTVLEQNLIKSDLSDVKVITNNTTSYVNGSHLVVDVTNVTDIIVRFGNYLVDYSYNNHSLSANTTNISGYTEINPYYVYTFLDESTGIEQLPPNSTRTVSLFCVGGSTSFNLTDTTILVSSFIELNETRTTIEYSATEMYSRNLINSNPIEYRNFYLVDAEKHQVVEIMFTLQDYTYNYDNGYMRIKKYLEGTLQTITESQFDLEDKVITYLINGDKYQLYIDSEDGLHSTNIGLLTVDTIDLTKTIVIGNFSSVNSQIGKLFYNLTFDADADMIRFFVRDPSGSMNNVSFWVYNITNTSQLLYFASSSNDTQVNFNYEVPDNTTLYKVEFKIAHDLFGANSYGSGSIMGDPSLSMLVFPYVSFPSYIKTGFSVIIILGSALIFGSMFGALGGIIAVAISGLLVYFGLIEITSTILAVAMFFALTNKIRGDRRA